MTDDNRASNVFEDVSRERLEELQADAAGVARSISDAFEATGDAISQAFESAARAGRVTLNDLAQDIVATFAELAVDRIVEGPLTRVFESALSSVPFLGARAEGGPVTPGGAYLVGETGPELFRPASSGDVSPADGAPVVVNFHFQTGSDAAQLRRSESQISTLVARAVARGRRNL